MDSNASKAKISLAADHGGTILILEGLRHTARLYQIDATIAFFAASLSPVCAILRSRSPRRKAMKVDWTADA